MRQVKNVYFLRPIGADGPVKIGCSIRPKSRMVEFSRWSPVPLEIAAVAVGGHDHERDLHKRFSAHRLHGEWFSPCPALLDLIAEIGRGAELPRPSVRSSVQAGFDYERARAMRVLRREGLTYATIGERFELTRQRVKQILDELYWRDRKMNVTGVPRHPLSPSPTAAAA